MNEPTDRDELLREFFKLELAVPPHLVSTTVQRIRERDRIGGVIGAAALNTIILIIMAGFLWAAPVSMLWKLMALMVFCIVQGIAAALLIYKLLDDTRSMNWSLSSGKEGI